MDMMLAFWNASDAGMMAGTNTPEWNPMRDYAKGIQVDFCAHFNWRPETSAIIRRACLITIRPANKSESGFNPMT